MAQDPSSLPADTRNLHWKNNNVGSKLLAKMGWKDGQAIGKRKRKKEDNEETLVSSEGLRVRKRETGLGLGFDDVTSRDAAIHSKSHDSFSNILENLQEIGKQSKKRKTTDKKTKESKKPKTSATVFAPNKMTHSKVRHAKLFAEKSHEDMAAIFGKTVSAFVMIKQDEKDTQQSFTQDKSDTKSEKKKKKKKEKKDKKQERSDKKKTKKSKKESK